MQIIIYFLIFSILAAIIFFLIRYKELNIDVRNSESNPIKNKNQEFIFDTWQMPLEGKVLPLKEIPDEAFAKGYMGQGFAIEPSNNELIAPTKGIVISLFPTKHAIGIECENGAEILFHIGVDAVRLRGEGFNSLVKVGDSFSTGDVLIRFDIDKIREKISSIVTAVLFINLIDNQKIELINNVPVILK